MYFNQLKAFNIFKLCTTDFTFHLYNVHIRHPITYFNSQINVNAWAVSKTVLIYLLNNSYDQESR